MSVHTWVDIAGCLLTPLVIGFVLWRFCDDEPHNEEPPDQHSDQQTPPKDMRLAA